MKKLLCCALVVMAAPTLAFAELCHYTPSAVIGGKKGAAASAATATGAGATVAAGVGLKAAGFYALPACRHWGNDAGVYSWWSVGRRYGEGLWGERRAQWERWQMPWMSPFVIIPAATVAAGIVVFEGGCYLADW